MTPFKAGYVLVNVQTDTANSIFSGMACLGAALLFILYLLDFYNAPHLVKEGDEFLQELGPFAHEKYKPQPGSEQVLRGLFLDEETLRSKTTRGCLQRIVLHYYREVYEDGQVCLL